jgi:hypothetical protein
MTLLAREEDFNSKVISNCHNFLLDKEPTVWYHRRTYPAGEGFSWLLVFKNTRADRSTWLRAAITSPNFRLDFMLQFSLVALKILL